MGITSPVVLTAADLFVLSDGLREFFPQSLGPPSPPWYKWDVIPEKLRGINSRLATALACYAVLAVIAIFALDGFFRSVVLFFFAILAVKSIAHAKDEEMK
jgi:hypothetical protein